MTEFETFMVYELDDSGEKIRLDIKEKDLQENLHPEQVLVIIREDLRRIFIWKGPKSPVRKRFISSRVAQTLQEELMNDARYHRCKIVSVDAGDEPTEFLNAFRLESMEVTERLEDMRYVRNIERERGIQATITDLTPDSSKTKSEEEYFSPALQDTSSAVVKSSYTPRTSSSSVKSAITKPSNIYKAVGFSEAQKQKIKEKILENKVSNGYKRSNLIMGHTLYAAVSKKAKIFGNDVEETEWEPIKKAPKEIIELENHFLRVYFDTNQGIVEAVEVLEKQTSSSEPVSSTKKETIPEKLEVKNQEKEDFNSMTVKELKNYAGDKNIDLPSSARKAEIIKILEKAREKKPNSRRNLPKIPSNNE
ncbi:MAG: hypothetical protein ACFE9Z_13095 [Promethearchaeota archaeon]